MRFFGVAGAEGRVREAAEVSATNFGEGGDL